MANLTITVDGDTLKRARVRAIERGESVNQYLARKLAEYAEGGLAERRASAARQFVALSEELAGGSGGATWTREDLYDDASRGGVR
ncbi:MAG: hypothetical protein QM602_10710 [Microbacterium sp.]